MNYASVQKGLKAVLTPLERRPLPSPPLLSRLSRFILEEKGDESQPGSELARARWRRFSLQENSL